MKDTMYNHIYNISPFIAPCGEEIANTAKDNNREPIMYEGYVVGYQPKDNNSKDYIVAKGERYTIDETGSQVNKQTTFNKLSKRIIEERGNIGKSGGR